MNFASMVRRIEREYKLADVSTRAVGNAWYQNAFATCRRMADAYGNRIHVDGIQAAGIVAALSPRCPWVVNLEWAETMIKHYAAGKVRPPAVSTKTLRAVAWNITTGAQPLEAIRGRKCRDFFRAIIGDESIAVIDTWSQYLATGSASNNLHRGMRYDLIQSAYRVAAGRLNVPPRELQAITWVSVRRREGRQFAEPDGFQVSDLTVADSQSMVIPD